MRSINRFLDAQEKKYSVALSELKAGRKQSHWMWYIFPQIEGLSKNSYAVYYSIVNRAEAICFLHHPVLSKRLQECCQVLLELDCNDPQRIFGTIDSMKLKSSMTLFDAVDAGSNVFTGVLDKFYGGEKDQKTLDLLSNVSRVDYHTEESILHHGMTYVNKGEMRDFDVRYQVYGASDCYIVDVIGRGLLNFNLRDFNMKTSIDIPYHVVVTGEFDTVDYRSFFDWISLRSIQLPRSIRKIKHDAFSDCDHLEVIVMPGDIECFSEDMFCYTQPKEIVFYSDCSVNHKLASFFKSNNISVKYKGRYL